MKMEIYGFHRLVLEKSFKMLEIIDRLKKEKNISDLPNVDLIEYLDKLSIEFEILKNNIISMTHKLDEIEMFYNKILKEYQSRV